ncbi:MAG: RNHCP domain-containing protein [Silvanigrellaceae bacterium]|nr:RNHCP domain-containing protein [Silvanigrellaceae bacterium]
MTVNTPQFTKRNEEFTCQNCSANVPKSSQTCRDHCPYCLFSLHVDNFPGDRASECKGTLKPVSWSVHKKKGYMIHYLCQSCGIKKVNKFLQHDKEVCDDFSKLIALNSVIEK